MHLQHENMQYKVKQVCFGILFLLKQHLLFQIGNYFSNHIIFLIQMCRYIYFNQTYSSTFKTVLNSINYNPLAYIHELTNVQ